MILPQGTWVVKGKRDWLMKVFTIRADTWIVKTGHENTAIHTYPRCKGWLFSIIPPKRTIGGITQYSIASQRRWTICFFLFWMGTQTLLNRHVRPNKGEQRILSPCCWSGGGASFSAWKGELLHHHPSTRICRLTYSKRMSSRMFCI